MSILLRPSLELSDIPFLTIVAAVACARALRKVTSAPVEIKWPNDLMLSGRKVGGILTESKSKGGKTLFAVVGIGINLNSAAGDFPSELRETSTSIRIEKGRKVPKDDLVASIVEEMEVLYDMLIKRGKGRILDECRQLSCTLGRSVRVIAGDDLFEGTAEALDRDGRLVVRLQSGDRKVVNAGDVTMVR